jgi:hypothetical protein
MTHSRLADFQAHSVVHGPGAVGINDLGHIAGTDVERVPCETCGIGGEPGFTFMTRLCRNTQDGRTCTP